MWVNMKWIPLFLKIIGLTSKDVSVTRVLQKNNKKVTYPDFGILGLGKCPGKVCVISSYRLKNNVNMFAKTVVHEFMHTLGVKHCEHSYCIMQDGKGSGKNMKESNHVHKNCLTQANQELYKIVRFRKGRPYYQSQK